MSRPPSLPAFSDGQRISLVRLLAAFLKIGIIGSVGGMAVIALMDREFVQNRKFLAAKGFLHGVWLGQILGSSSVKGSLFFVGYRLFGPMGGIPSAGVFLMPSLVLVTALSHFYFRYHELPPCRVPWLGWDRW